MNNLNHCSACGQALTWALTAAGKTAPINTNPSDNGNVLILAPRDLGQKLAITLSGISLDLARKHSLPLHLNHFADCPEADQFTAEHAERTSRR
jgi:hypothetical protein